MEKAYDYHTNRQQYLSVEIIPWRVGQEQRFLQERGRGPLRAGSHRATTGILDALSLRTLGGFQWVETLGRWLDSALGMGGEIAPPKDPFRRWISVDLAILAIVVLHDVATPFA